jgi:rare lipoprotein A
MKTLRFFLLIIFLALLGAGCAGPTSQVRLEPAGKSRTTKTFYGVASWYGREFHGRPTASGERYNMYAYTAAHRSLPFGTVVRVTNLRNNYQAVVRINDRGPFARGREIDLSYVAARDLKMLDTGLEKVRLEILSG